MADNTPLCGGCAGVLVRDPTRAGLVYLPCQNPVCPFYFNVPRRNAFSQQAPQQDVAVNRGEIEAGGQADPNLFGRPDPNQIDDPYPDLFDQPDPNQAGQRVAPNFQSPANANQDAVPPSTPVNFNEFLNLDSSPRGSPMDVDDLAPQTPVRANAAADPAVGLDELANILHIGSPGAGSDIFGSPLASGLSPPPNDENGQPGDGLFRWKPVRVGPQPHPDVAPSIPRLWRFVTYRGPRRPRPPPPPPTFRRARVKVRGALRGGYTEDEQRRFETMLMQGSTNQEIADAVGRTRNAIVIKRRREFPGSVGGVPCGPPNAQASSPERSGPFTRAERALLDQLVQQGMDDAQIASQMDRSESTIRRKRRRGPDDDNDDPVGGSPSVKRRRP